MKLLKDNLKLFAVEESGGSWDDAWNMISSIWVTRELAEKEIKRCIKFRDEYYDKKKKNGEWFFKEEVHYTIIEYYLNKPIELQDDEN